MKIKLAWFEYLILTVVGLIMGAALTPVLTVPAASVLGYTIAGSVATAICAVIMIPPITNYWGARYIQFTNKWRDTKYVS